MISVNSLDEEVAVKCIACGDLADFSITMQTYGNIKAASVHYYCSQCAEILAEGLLEEMAAVNEEEFGESTTVKPMPYSIIHDNNPEEIDNTVEDGVATLSKKCDCEDIPCK